MLAINKLTSEVMPPKTQLNLAINHPLTHTHSLRHVASLQEKRRLTDFISGVVHKYESARVCEDVFPDHRASPGVPRTINESYDAGVSLWLRMLLVDAATSRQHFPEQHVVMECMLVQFLGIFPPGRKALHREMEFGLVRGEIYL